MPTPRENNIWSNIRIQLSSVQKELLDGKYNDAALTSREILKTLVRLQMDQACLVSTDLDGDIDQLFENRIISAASRDRFHAVSQLAGQAESGAVINAQTANDAFSMIRQELSDYVDQNQRSQNRGAAAYEEDRELGPEASLSKRYSTGSSADGGLDVPIRRRRSEESSGERERVKLTKSSSGKRSSASASGNRSGRTAGKSGARSNSSRSTRGTSSARRSSGRRVQEEPVEFDIYNVLKIAIPVICVILIVILIRVLSSGGKSEIQTTAAPTTAVETTAAPVVTEPETTEPETTEAPKRWVTTDGVRVRTKPSTEDSEVLTVLEPGTEVSFKSVYNDEWIAIDYNGQEAYVASAYVRSEEIS